MRWIFFSLSLRLTAASSWLIMRIKGRGVYGNKRRPSPIRITVIGFEQSYGSGAKEEQGRAEERGGEEKGGRGGEEKKGEESAAINRQPSFYSAFRALPVLLQHGFREKPRMHLSGPPCASLCEPRTSDLILHVLMLTIKKKTNHARAHPVRRHFCLRAGTQRHGADKRSK